MPIKAEKQRSAIAMDSMSTKAAAAVLASQTRAFGNKYSKLSLQHATDAFLRAKEDLLRKSEANENAAASG
jgi:hypothetical protein